MCNRRTFLKTGAVVLTTAAAHRPLLAQVGSRRDPVLSIQDPRIKELTQRALDAARTAGATYADVRFTRTHIRRIGGESIEYEWLNVGVRALVNGYWGFASSSLWHADEMPRLATQAVRQATAGSLGKIRQIELAPLDTPAIGHWETPVEIDPFTVPLGEILDYKQSLDAYAKKRVAANGYDFFSSGMGYSYVSEEKAFGSMDGSYCTQRLLRSSGNPYWSLGNGRGTTRILMDRLPNSGTGWELYVGQPLRDYTDQAIDEAIYDNTLPEKPVEIGRYDVVWDAASVAQFLGSTVGQATEADRVMGYEANATGTSYLTAPHEMLGAFSIGSPLLTVTGNRTEKSGVATVRWDDDGVTPEEFTLVKKGVLHDLSTTRESAVWFKEHYAKTGRPLRSHGCALDSQDMTGRGISIPTGGVPNLQMTPGAGALDFNTCVAGVSQGIAFQQMAFNMDFQQSNGIGSGKAFEIRNGKRVAKLRGAGLHLRARDLWKSLTVLGGEQSRRRFGQSVMKGEPSKWHYYSVSAVPAVFTNAMVMDVLRRP